MPLAGLPVAARAGDLIRYPGLIPPHAPRFLPPGHGHLALAPNVNYPTGAALRMPEIYPGDRVLFVGDSVTALGFNMVNDLDPEGRGPGWGEYIQQILPGQRPGCQFFGAGIGGTTTADLINTMQGAINTYNPTVLVIEIGTNDVGRGLTLEQTSINFGRLVATGLANQNIREVVLVTPFGYHELPNGQNLYDTQLDNIHNFLLQVVAEKNNPRLSVIPMRYYFWYGEAKANPLHIPEGILLRRSDGIHPSGMVDGGRGMLYYAAIIARYLGLAFNFEIDAILKPD